MALQVAKTWERYWISTSSLGWQQGSLSSGVLQRISELSARRGDSKKERLKRQINTKIRNSTCNSAGSHCHSQELGDMDRIRTPNRRKLCSELVAVGAATYLLSKAPGELLSLWTVVHVSFTCSKPGREPPVERTLILHTKLIFKDGGRCYECVEEQSRVLSSSLCEYSVDKIETIIGGVHPRRVGQRIPYISYIKALFGGKDPFPGLPVQLLALTCIIGVAIGGDGEGGDNSGKWIHVGAIFDSTLKPATVSSWRPAKKVH